MKMFSTHNYLNMQQYRYFSAAAAVTQMEQSFADNIYSTFESSVN